MELCEYTCLSLLNFICFKEIHFEIIHQIYGKQPLQNGGERRVNQTWLTFYYC